MTNGSDAPVLVVDCEDAPHAGGGAALARALARRGIRHRSLAFESLASIPPEVESNGEFIAEADLQVVLREVGPRARVLPGSTRAVRLLSEVALRDPSLLSLPLRRALMRPRHQSALAAALVHGLPCAPHRLLREPESGPTYGDPDAPSHLLLPSGVMQAVNSSDEAWFQARRARRAGDGPALGVGRLGARTFQAAIVARRGESRALAVLVLDGVSATGRVSLGRTVDGAVWREFAGKLASSPLMDGFALATACILPGETEPLLMDLRLSWPDWLEVAGPDGGPVLHAALGGKGGVVPAGRYYTAVPIDRPLDVDSLIARIRKP